MTNSEDAWRQSPLNRLQKSPSRPNWPNTRSPKCRDSACWIWRTSRIGHDNLQDSTPDVVLAPLCSEPLPS